MSTAVLPSFLPLLLGIFCSLHVGCSLHISIFQYLTLRTFHPHHITNKTSPSSQYRIFWLNFLMKLFPVQLALSRTYTFPPLELSSNPRPVAKWQEKQVRKVPRFEAWLLVHFAIILLCDLGQVTFPLWASVSSL